MKKRVRSLAILCPQLYVGTSMKIVGCSRCENWDENGQRCRVEMGCEHLPLVPSGEVPTCPIQERCQHQVQLGEEPCPVRARGMVCESALRRAGEKNPEENPLSFHAMTVAEA